MENETDPLPFDGDVAEIMDQIILTGQVSNKKQELGYFPTPAAVVDRLLDIAQIEPGMLVLEPSAGQGAIAGALPDRHNVSCIEIDRNNVDVLLSKGMHVLCDDFLSIRSRPRWDRMVMNPPFAKQDDVRHVLHALTMLKPKGRLVSVMASGITFRTNALTNKLRAIIDERGSIEALPANSFAESGTNVNTVIVTIDN